MRKVLRTYMSARKRRHESLRAIPSSVADPVTRSWWFWRAYIPTTWRHGENSADVSGAAAICAETLFPGAVLEREQVSPDTDGALRADASVYPAERESGICILARDNDEEDAQGEGIKNRFRKR